MLIAIWGYIGIVSKWRHVDSKFRHVDSKCRHVAVLTRPQTLSLIIFQIAPCAGDGNSLR